MEIILRPQTLFFTNNRSINIKEEIIIKNGITALIGPNGSGKSTFIQILEKGWNFRTNKIESDSSIKPKIRIIEFNDIHSLPGVSVEYYQQRYEEAMNEETPTVGYIFGDKCEKKEFKEYCNEFKLTGVIEKKINSLSSGELRKLLIINALLDLPDVLIIDNPFIGLDVESKKVFLAAIKRLKQKGDSIMLVIQDDEDAPDYTDHYLYTQNLTIANNKSKSNEPSVHFEINYTDKKNEDSNCDVIFSLKDCNIKYGNTTILDNVSWEVKKGERWSLSGPNGSGKSTLLSLLNADNPKSYSNDITLFGQKRGTGESIWDIKKKIGYVSPEMKLHFHGSGSILHLVANGLNDTVGLFVRPSAEQKEKALEWLKHFNIEHLKDKSYKSLSSGEKQLVLIARSFIKEPSLLILDEPMHALDKDNRSRVLKTLESFLEHHRDSSFIMVTHNQEYLPPSIDHHLKLEN